jgi:PKHD-type hydroxylase
MTHHLLEVDRNIRNYRQRRDTIADAPEFFSAPLNFLAVFSPAECRSIVELGRKSPPAAAGPGRPIESYRIADSTIIEANEKSHWIYQRLSERISLANQWYRFATTDMPEPLLYCEYPAGGRFGWHVDCGDAPTGSRKISASVQLSDDEDYTGGALEFAMVGELPDSRVQGAVIAFPAFMPHRVEPVLSGVRCALVAWMHGPVFR